MSEKKCIFKPCQNKPNGIFPACSFDHLILHKEIISGNLFDADYRARGFGMHHNLCDEISVGELSGYANSF